MNRGCVLLGSGGHASVVFEQLNVLGLNVQGWVGPHEATNGKAIFSEISYLGTDSDFLRSNSSASCVLVNGVGSLPYKSHRKEIFSTLKNHGFKFLTLIACSSIVSSHAEIGEGVQIMPGAIVNAGAKIGANSIKNRSK